MTPIETAARLLNEMADKLEGDCLTNLPIVYADFARRCRPAATALGGFALGRVSEPAAICKGSWVLGTACEQCERCREDAPRFIHHLRASLKASQDRMVRVLAALPPPSPQDNIDLTDRIKVLLFDAARAAAYAGKDSA